MLWGNWLSGDAVSIVEILKIVAQASPLNALTLLSRAPTVQALSEVVTAAALTRAQMLDIASSVSNLKNRNAPLKDFEKFLEQARDEEQPALPWLILLFVLTHFDTIPQKNLRAVIEVIIEALQADLLRSKQLLLGIVDALFPFLTSTDLNKFAPLMLKAIGGNSTKQFISQTRRMVRGKSVSIDPSVFSRLCEILSKRPQDERELLELITDLLEGDSKLFLPSELENQMMKSVLMASAANRRDLLRCLSAAASRSASPLESLQEIVPVLESLVGVSDYESSQRRRNLQDSFSRPIDDSELYAFHDESDEVMPRAEMLGESTAERIAILTEVMRHKLCAERGDFQAAPEVLLSVCFPLLANRLKSCDSDLEKRQILRALANISTLARSVSVEVRDRFLILGKSIVPQITGVRSAYAQAELRRLEHNLRCLPVKSAPMLIDSFLPMSAFTPADADVDLVFVHGLRGGLHSWRYLNQPQEGPFEMWPEACLSPSFPKVRLLAFTYEAPLWYATHKQHYSEVDVKRNFEEIAIGLRNALADAGVGRNGKKVVFVCFSMGGLISKQALITDAELRKNTLGIVFFATPHLGSPIADYAYYSPVGGLVSPFVADLSRKSKQVALLHESFTSMCGHVPSLSVCETAPSDLGAGLKSFIVPFDSCSACKSGKSVPAGDDMDHEAVSKIRHDLGVKDPRVTALLEFLTSLIDTN